MIPGLGRPSGAGTGNPLQYSCPENFMDRGAWRATVCGVAKSQTRLSEHRTACVTRVYTDCYATCPVKNKGNTVSVFNLGKRKLEWCKGHEAGRKGIRLWNEMAE